MSRGKSIILGGLLFAVLFIAIPQNVSANPLAGRAASMLTDQVMRGLRSGIADLAAKAPVPEELKPEVEQKLTEAARRIVHQHVQGAMGGRLPNPAQLVQQVLGELRNVVNDVANSALAASGSAPAQTGGHTPPQLQGGVIVHHGTLTQGAQVHHGHPQNVAATNTFMGAAAVHAQASPAPRERPRLTIAPISSAEQTLSPEELRMLAQILHIAVGNAGVYNVLPPRSAVVRAVVDELGARHSVEDRVKAIGTATGADFVLLPDVRRLGNLNMLSMQIYNAQNGALIVGEIINFRGIEDGAEQLPQVAAQLANKGIELSPPAPAADIQLTTPQAIVELTRAVSELRLAIPNCCGTQVIHAQREKLPPLVGRDHYFSVKWLPPITDETRAGWGFNLEYGQIWGNGGFWGIDFSLALRGKSHYDGYWGYYDYTFDELVGGGISIGYTYGSPRNVEFVVGGSAGFWWTNRYEYHSQVRRGFGGPLVKLRWNFVEVSYRGIIAQEEWGYYHYHYNSGVGYISQLMVGYHFQTMRRVRR